MDLQNLKIVEAAITIAIYIFVKLLVNKYINRFVVENLKSEKRSRIVRKVINVTIFIIFFIVLLSVFGVDKSEFMVFISTVLTVIGIALFAQWSILSNITSGIIIFFNSEVKIEDSVKIMDKEYEIEGKIMDIGLFFIHIKTLNGEDIHIPNSVFLNKMIKKKID